MTSVANTVQLELEVDHLGCTHISPIFSTLLPYITLRHTYGTLAKRNKYINAKKSKRHRRRLPGLRCLDHRRRGELFDRFAGRSDSVRRSATVVRHAGVGLGHNGRTWTRPTRTFGSWAGLISDIALQLNLE